MSRRDDTITLRQMLDHIEEAVALAKIGPARTSNPTACFSSLC
jgi:hypothetical protein